MKLRASLLFAMILSVSSKRIKRKSKEQSMKRGGASFGDKNYDFIFSCHHDEVRNEHTSCHVTVKFFDLNEYNFYTKEFNRVHSCGTEKVISYDGDDGYYNLNYIEMETDCGDALLINYAKIRTENLFATSYNDGVHQHITSTYDYNYYGGDGPGFNCLSTDADDWKTSGKGHRSAPCDSCYRFRIDSPEFWIC